MLAPMSHEFAIDVYMGNAVMKLTEGSNYFDLKFNIYKL